MRRVRTLWLATPLLLLLLLLLSAPSAKIDRRSG